MIKFNPCGRGVDWGRRTYKTTLAPFFNSGPTVTIRWFRRLPDAGWMPFPVFTTSSDWASDQGMNLKLGEVYGAKRTFEYNNANPAATGKHFCGTEEQWFYGQDVNDGFPFTIYQDSGLPECCGVVNVTEICMCTGIEGKTNKNYHEVTNVCWCTSPSASGAALYRESSTVFTGASVDGVDELIPEEKSTVFTGASVDGVDELIPEEKSTVDTRTEPSGEFICCVPGAHTVITQAGTCSLANVCSPTNTYFMTTTTDTLAWYRFDVPDGETWYFKNRTPCNSDLGGGYSLYTGTDCGTLVVVDVGLVDCMSFTGPAMFWVSIVINHEGGCVFSTCGIGTCP